MGPTSTPPWLLSAILWVTLLLQVTHASPTGYDLEERSSASTKCSYTSSELATLEANLGAPLAFCKYWTGVNFRRTHSPFLGLTADEVTSVCKCVVATPSILGNTATSAMATASPTSNVKNLFALEKAVASPLLFCDYWFNANFIRDMSPFPGLSAAAVSSVCKSVTATPTLVAKTTAKHTSTATKKATTTSTHKHTTPSTKKTSTSTKLTTKKKTTSTKQSTTHTSKKSTTTKTSVKTTSTGKTSRVKSSVTRAKTSSSSATTGAHTGRSTLKSISSSFVNNGHTSAVVSGASIAATNIGTADSTATTAPAEYSAAASSAAASSAATALATNSTGTYTTTNSTGNNSVAGVEYQAAEVTLAGPAKASLGPIAPIGLDLTSLDNLSPADTVPMYYGSAASDNSTNTTVAKLSTSFTSPSIVLDHTVYIDSVTCPSATELVAIFNEQSAFLHSESQWTANGSVILITSDASCGGNGSNAMFLTSSVSFDSVDLTATAQGSIVSFADVLDNMDLDFGTVTGSNVTTTNATNYAPDCGTAPTNSSFATAACGVNFDQLLDDTLGYYSGADADQQTTLAALSPGSTTSSLSRRSWWSKLKSIVHAVVAPIKAAVKAVAAVVTPLLPKIVVQAISVAASIALNAVNTAVAIANFVATGSYSKTLSMSIDVGPAASFPSKLESSPWGEQFKFYEWKPEAADEKESEKVKQWKENLVKVANQLIGEPDPEPGIEMFCVDCGVKGQLEAVGSLSVSLAHGVTNLQVSLNGNLYAGVFVGVNAFAEYKKDLTQNLITVGLPGFEIPDIVVIGPSISLGVQAGLDVTAEGQILVGASMTWPSISADLNLLDKSKSYQSGFTPVITKKFEAHGDITLTADLGLPVTLAFGVNILNGKWKKGIELIDTPAITATAEFQADIDVTSSSDNGTSVSASVNQGDGCYGIEWSVMLTNDLELNLLDLANYQLAHWQSPPLASGCIGTSITAAVTSTLSTSTKTSSTVKATTTSTTVQATTTSLATKATATSNSFLSSIVSSSKSSAALSSSYKSSSTSWLTSTTASVRTSTSASSIKSSISSYYSTTTKSAYYSTSVYSNTTATSATTTAAAATSSGICNSLYSTADGYPWTIQCATDYRTGTNLVVTSYSNIYSCINACDDYGNSCKGIVWVYSGQGQQYCYLKSDVSSPTTLPSGISAYAAVRGSIASVASSSTSAFVSSLVSSTRVSNSSLISSATSSLISSSSLANSSVTSSSRSVSSTLLSSSSLANSSITSSSQSTSVSSASSSVVSSSISSSVVSSTTTSSSTTSTSAAPTYSALGSCPGVNNTLFYDATGATYKILCSEDFSGNLVDTSSRPKTLEACINLCDTNIDAGCAGVSFAYGGSYQTSHICYMWQDFGGGTTYNTNTTDGYSYNVDSAVLVANATSTSSLARRRRDDSESDNSSTDDTAAATSSTADDSGSAATTTVAASAATSTVISSAETNVTITDTENTLQLMPADNGNLYVDLYVAANATANWGLSNNLILGDAAGRLLHYYPETMDAYNASRLRLADWGNIPHSANLISLAPLQVTANTTFLVGLDSLGNHYYPVVCSFQGPMPMKVFLVKDAMADLSFLADTDLRFIMTGGIVDQCNTLALTPHGVTGFS